MLPLKVKLFRSPDIGGIVVPIKNFLPSQVYNVDKSLEGQVWLQIKSVDSILFGFS